MRVWIGGAFVALSCVAGTAQAATLFTASATAQGGPVKAFATPSLAVTHNFIPSPGARAPASAQG